MRRAWTGRRQHSTHSGGLGASLTFLVMAIYSSCTATISLRVTAGPGRQEARLASRRRLRRRGFFGVEGIPETRRPGFEDWLRSTRDGSDDGEREYKATLAEALAWGRGFKEGAKACAAWTEAQEASALASETLSQNPPADEGPGAKLVGRATRPRRCRPAR